MVQVLSCRHLPTVHSALLAKYHRQASMVLLIHYGSGCVKIFFPQVKC
jgi:hypothetical protein